MTPLAKIVTASLLFVSLFAAARNSRAQESRPAAPLSIEEIVQLHNAGFSDDVIVTRIRKNAKAFDLSTDELLELKKAGLSDTIVRFLLDPAQPYSATPAPAPPPATQPGEGPPAGARPPRQFPPDEYSSQVPAEPGLYRFEEGKPVRIDLKLLLALKGGGAKLGKVMLKKDKGLAYLVGPAAKTRTTEPSPVFYLRLPEGKGIEEIVLIALDRKAERRELETGPAAPKPELKSEAIRPLETVEVAPQLFRLTPSKLAAGEYLFFQIGSADPAKGSAGKGFDFGVDPVSPQKK
jgi:hypothetical protein